jgi:hypothetical protein
MKKKLLRAPVGSTNLTAVLKGRIQEITSIHNQTRNELVQRDRVLEDGASLKAISDSHSSERQNLNFGVLKGNKRLPAFRSSDYQKQLEDDTKSQHHRAGHSLDMNVNSEENYLTKLSRDPFLTKASQFGFSGRVKSVDHKENLEKKRFRRAPPDTRKGKLASIMAALEQIHTKLGSSDFMRMYLQRWASADHSSAISIPDFIHRLDLMGYSVSEDQAKSFAAYIMSTDQPAVSLKNGSEPTHIPLKDLSVIGALAKQTQFRSKLDSGTDSELVRASICKIEKSRQAGLEDRLFMARFGKVKDQVVTVLKDQEKLDEEKVFKLLAHVGLAVETVDDQHKKRFVSDYLDADGRLKVKDFYSDVEKIYPNKTRNVRCANAETPAQRGAHPRA